MGFMRSVGVRLRLWTDQYRQDGAKAAETNERVADSGKKTRKSLDDMAMGFGLVGGAMLAAAAAVVYTTAKFEKQMSEVGAVSGATAEEFRQLREAALAAGASTVYSASESAEAIAELAKAGVSTADILAGGLNGALALAAAGSLDLATAATIASNAMNTFGLAGADVTHIADVLSAAANKSAVGVEDLGLGLQQVGLVANQVGFGLEETVGLLAAFGDVGLRGSDGATSLKTALLRLAAPLGEAQALMKELGISLYDANGNMVDAVTIAGQLQAGLGKLTAAQRNSALAVIFGSDAIRAANVMYGLGADGVKEYIDAVNDQGAAARVAAEKLNNLAGDVRLLGSALEGLFIKSGTGAQGPLRELTQGLTGMVTQFGAMPSAAQTSLVAVVGITGAALLGAAAFIKLRAGVISTVESMTALGPAGARAGRAFQAVAGFAGRLTGIFMATAAAGLAVKAAIGDEVPADVQSLSQSLEKFARTGELSGEALRVLGGGFEQLKWDIQNIDSSVLNKIDETVAGIADFLTFGADVSGYTSAENRLKALDEALGQMVRSGNADAAAKVFQEVVAAASMRGIDVADVNRFFVGYQRALEEVDPALAAVAAQQAQVTSENIRMAGAFGAAASEVNGLRSAFDKATASIFGWRSAQRDAEAAVDDLQEALKESNGSLDVTSEEGRAAEAAIDALAQAAAQAAQAKYDETQSVEDANAVWENYIGQLRDTLLAAGHTEDAVDTLLAKIAQMPTYKALTIDVKVRRPSSVTVWGQGFTENRYGGLYAAADGLLSTSRMFAAGPRPLFAFAEPQTGGEAFVAKNAPRDRSLAILGEAASWHGAQVVPAGGAVGSGTTGPSAVDVRVTIGGADSQVKQAIADLLRVDVVQVGGGSVQDRYGSRGRVG